MNSELLEDLFAGNGEVAPVVDFDRGHDKLFNFNFTGAAPEPTAELISNLPMFSEWVKGTLARENCRYGIGGYEEKRVLYTSKELFENNKAEARSLHLGTDIWGPAGTPVYCPLPARVHSFAFNDRYGDYGATIILEHSLKGDDFFTLYGHLSMASISGLEKGMAIQAGRKFAEFGIESENGHWPPHLHLQVILDIGNYDGDYPGVCRPSEQKHWLANSPDPAIILKYTF